MGIEKTTLACPQCGKPRTRITVRCAPIGPDSDPFATLADETAARVAQYFADGHSPLAITEEVCAAVVRSFKGPKEVWSEGECREVNFEEMLRSIMDFLNVDRSSLPMRDLICDTVRSAAERTLIELAA
jgi:hypothetical protein